MEPNFSENDSLGASGRPLGASSAFGASPEPSWRGSGAAWGAQQIPWARPGALLGRKVDRFQGSGASPGGRRRLPERLWEAMLGTWKIP